MSVGCLASPYTFPGRVGIFPNRALLLGPIVGEGGVLGRGCCDCDDWGGLCLEGPAEGERGGLLMYRGAHVSLGGGAIGGPASTGPLCGDRAPSSLTGESAGRGGCFVVPQRGWKGAGERG